MRDDSQVHVGKIIWIAADAAELEMFLKWEVLELCQVYVCKQQLLQNVQISYWAAVEKILVSMC